MTIPREYLEGMGVDPKMGEFDTDIVEIGVSRSQPERMKQVTTIIDHLKHEEQFDAGAPYDEICSYVANMGITDEQVDHALDKLCSQDDAYRLKVVTIRPTG